MLVGVNSIYRYFMALKFRVRKEIVLSQSGESLKIQLGYRNVEPLRPEVECQIIQLHNL